MITLYDYVLSGNCYKVRLMASMLGVELQLHAIDFYPGNEHKKAAFLDINPLGELPVIDDNGYVLRDAQAILVYLASQYDTTERWYPRQDSRQLGQIHSWLSFADRITATASAARLHDMLRYDLNVESARQGAHDAFCVLDDHLHEQEFIDQGYLTGESATLADVACFPYVALARDGGIELHDYYAIGRWIDRIKSLDGFIDMPGIPPKF